MLNYELVISNMSILANQATKGHLDAVGVSTQDFNRLTSDDPWLGVEVTRMAVTLQTMIQGVSDVQNIPRFPLPAEYVASGIAFFVRGVNLFAACHYASLSHMRDTESLGRMPKSKDDGFAPEGCSAQRIFALVTYAYDHPTRKLMRALFEARTGLILERMKDGLPVSKK